MIVVLNERRKEMRKIMKVKDIIPIIEDGIVVWIYRDKSGRWTMPREVLIESNGDEKVNKIDIGKKEIMLHIK